MKKIFSVLSILFFLTIPIIYYNLSHKNEKTITKTCTVIQEDKLEQAYTYTANNDKLKKVKLVITYDNQTLNLSDDTIETLSDDKKEKLKNDTLISLGLEEKSYEGIEISTDIDKKIVITIDADLNKADIKILTKLGLNFKNTNYSFKKVIKNMQESGAFCQ